jgi:hypothetical protein
MPYADQPRSLTHGAPKRGRGGAAYERACLEVRARVQRGERCYFWRRRGHDVCPGRINLQLPSNHRWAFTAHHLRRLMDGGEAVVRSEDMAPAHRACNARDGLMAQNARRAQRAQVTRQSRMRARSSEVHAQQGSQSVTVRGSARDRQSQAW